MNTNRLSSWAWALLCVVAWGCAGNAGAQAAAASAPGVSMMDAVEHARSELQQRASSSKAAEQAPTALPESPSDAALKDPATRQTYLEAMKRFYEYRADGYAYRSRVFEWQLFSSKVIFGAVLLLVLAGVYFAAVQFHVALRSVVSRRGTRVEEAAAAAAKASDALRSEIDVSAKGVAVKSSVLGVVVLALSLAFYYLYLVYVYPIQNVM